MGVRHRQSGGMGLLLRLVGPSLLLLWLVGAHPSPQGRKIDWLRGEKVKKFTKESYKLVAAKVKQGLKVSARSPDDAECSPDQFTCGSGLCVPQSYRCDGDNDCSDRSDEVDCRSLKTSCSSNQFSCDNGDCIPNIYQCDLDADCGDASDEADCATCRPDQFRCDSGRCIQGHHKCDQDNDCGDGSDEVDCSSCDADQFSCDNGKCIRASYECDGDNDCGDLSDERGCGDEKEGNGTTSSSTNTTSSCSVHQFQCDNGRCISGSYQCDADDDCRDGSDEVDCECERGQFRCANQKCIRDSWRCDGDNDCGDLSDEQKCDGEEVSVVLNGTCAQTDTPCQNGANCTDLESGFTCSCLPGFSGLTCQTAWGGECLQPCHGENCQRLTTKMEHLLDMTVDPCEDFFQFACNPAGRGSSPPPVREPTVDFRDLVLDPPSGFEYIQTFYNSCSSISTNLTSEQVLGRCLMDEATHVCEMRTVMILSS